jgi:hypothetical protein
LASDSAEPTATKIAAVSRQRGPFVEVVSRARPDADTAPLFRSFLIPQLLYGNQQCLSLPHALTRFD